MYKPGAFLLASSALMAIEGDSVEASAAVGVGLARMEAREEFTAIIRREKVRNLGLGGHTCLDSPARRTDLHKPVGLYPCHRQGGNQIANKWSRKCVDAPSKSEEVEQAVGVWPCHNQGGNQYWMLSKTGEIRRDESCVDYAGHDVILYPCHGSKGNQYWEYHPKTHLIQHGSSKKCLAVSENKQKLLMEDCNRTNPRQQWAFENFNASKLEKSE